MYMPLPTPREMGEWDRMTIEEFGIMGEILMENASWQCVYALIHKFGPLKGKKIAILAGPGNNGGDGFAVARHLNDIGADVIIFYKKGLESYKKDAAYHVSLTLKAGIDTQKISEGELDLRGYDIIIDGLLGTGFSGNLREDYLKLVETINATKDNSYILAIDIPSGLNGLTGKPCPVAVIADCTVTFEEAKTGLFLPEAKKYVGDLVIGKIGIPSFIKKEHPPSFYGITKDILNSIPQISNMDHKSKAGHVLIIGGGKGLVGATTLSALSALKAGAGLVTVATPYESSLSVKLNWPEIMTIPLGERGDLDFTGEHYLEIKKELSRFHSVVIGPGMGRGDGAREFLKRYLDNDHPKTIIDADALYNLSKLNKINLAQDTILTPHPGEMGYLLGQSSSRVQENRFDSIKQAVGKFGCVVILKGAGTLIMGKGTKIYISNIACKNLAIGGSGDVLSGIIGTLRAKDMGAMDASCAGVMWHAMAGEYLEKKFPTRGNLAQDIAYALPEVISR